MQQYRLTDDFLDAGAERALRAALARNPVLYWTLADRLPAGVFAAEPAAWQQLAAAIAADQPPTVPAEWLPAPDVETTAAHLGDLYQRHQLAVVQERLAAALYDPSRPATELVALLADETARVQQALQAPREGGLCWGADVLPAVLQDAAARRAAYEATGKPVYGIPTDLPRLDELLGGLEPGLIILGGAPGVGKTSLARQIAEAATASAVAVYVTFENSVDNLVLQALAARANVDTRAIRRGQADLAKLREAAAAWRPVGARLAFVPGSSRLTVAQVQARALQAMHRHQAPQCVVIIDYIQLWAKAAEELRGLGSVRERVETLGAQLGDLARRLRSPVLVLSSQSRAQGDYGKGEGSAALDSLKESGDLEYSADVVLFLTKAKRPAPPPARAVDLTIAKHRHGETGTVELTFRPDVATIRELARHA